METFNMILSGAAVTLLVLLLAVSVIIVVDR